MKKKENIFWVLLISVAIFRVAYSFFYMPPDIGSCLKQNISGSGYIDEEPTRTFTGQILVINASMISFNGNICAKDIKIKAKTKLYPEYNMGDLVSFSGKLNLPMNFGSDNDRKFDYRGYLSKDDIFYEIKNALISKNKEYSYDNPFSWIEYRLFKLKKSFIANLDQTLGEPHSALASGLVVGEKSALGKDLLNDFRTVGLIHIVVLSGFNITVVADSMKKVLSFLPRVWGILIGAVGIFLFGILVGGGATVVRSCFMAGIALFAELIRRDYSVIRALMLAGLIMLIQNPLILLHDPSFQLSFLATLGLILLANPIEKRLTFLPEKFGLRGIIASTMATQIFVSPYILYMMGKLSIIGMVVNILVLPFIPVTMLFVFLTGTLGLIGYSVSLPFAWVCHFLLGYELFMVEKFAKIPMAAIDVPPFSFYWVIAFYLCFALIFFYRKTSKTSEDRTIKTI